MIYIESCCSHPCLSSSQDCHCPRVARQTTVLRAVLKLGLSLASSNVWPASTSHSKNRHWVFKYYSDCPWCSKPVNPTTQWMWDKAKAEASQVLGQPGLHNKFQATCGPQNREEQVSKVEDEPSIHEIVGSVSIIIRINKQQTLSQAFFNKDKAM